MEILKDLLHINKYNQRQLSRTVGLSEKQISNIMTGRNSIGRKADELLCYFFNLPLGCFIKSQIDFFYENKKENEVVKNNIIKKRKALKKIERLSIKDIKEYQKEYQKKYYQENKENWKKTKVAPNYDE